MPAGGFEMTTAGTINGLKEYKVELKKELAVAYEKVRPEIVRRAQAKAPVLTGRLQASIRPSAAKTSATVRIGGTKKVPYAGPAHWGWDGETGPWFLWRVGYPHATKDQRGLVADWIFQEFADAANRATRRLNRKLAKDIGLTGPAMTTSGPMPGDVVSFADDVWTLEAPFDPGSVPQRVIRLGL